MDIFLESAIDTCIKFWYTWCKLPEECVFSSSLSTTLYGYTVTTKQQTSELIGPKSERWLNVTVMIHSQVQFQPSSNWPYIKIFVCLCTHNLA